MSLSPTATDSDESPGSRAPLRAFPTSGFTVIPPDGEILDEEMWPWYTSESFYPVYIGEVIHSRYQVLYKLGFGTASTVWMCRDLELDKYVCLKSMMLNDPEFPSVDRELKAYEAISKAAAENPNGFATVRQALDQFHLVHAGKDYHFIVHEPLGLSLGDIVASSGGKFPLKTVWTIAREFLSTLETIHNAKIVHTDVSGRNIHFSIQDEDVFKEMEEDEMVNPSTRKILNHSTIYATKRFFAPGNRWMGDKRLMVLCDFGEARIGQESYQDESAQPHEYRAPEVFLDVPWSTPADIWSFGCMIWELMTGIRLFPRLLKDNRVIANKVQMAAMTRVFGPAPKALLDAAGPKALEFFDEDGSPKYEVEHPTLDSILAYAIEEANPPVSPEQSEAFLAFVRRIFIWEPHKRPSASDLLKDPWIVEIME